MIDDTSEEEYEKTQEEIAWIKIKIFLTFLISFFLFLNRLYKKNPFLI
jgi:hypothetical protein